MKKFLLICSFLWVVTPSFSQSDSLDIKIGQMIMIGMNGSAVTDQSPIINAIQKRYVGGVLLFEFNLNPFQTETKLAALTNKLQDAASIPLIIAIDQEGGKVNRLKTKYGFKEMPSAKTIGLKNDDEYTTEIGNTIADALQRCGINMNFAPVLDVDNPNCPVLGKLQRCYDADVSKITHMASLIMEAHAAKGIKTVVKHFPGHGNSRTDSHKGLADVSNYWTQKELLPYKNLLASNHINAIMTGHLINKKLDPSGMPATLSKKIINDLLRTEMGYQGVVISDDMQMHAISKYYGLKESIRLGILAGVDIFIFSNNIENATQYTPANIHASIKKMVLNHEISLERIDESYQRIMSMKMSR
ncbi:MAG: glycoside hydrolase family 3 protein [Bacteroidetes bacterium]|jgi:beta-N-acetylhexosaminidase|nr:glycoside hydrolase family 3 protein [Bacteroidota bacterium]